jgi:hypothetical protein
MIHFAIRMETPNGMVSLYFNGLLTADGIRYHISFVDREGKVHIIIMDEHKGRWKIINPQNYPEWIVSLESEFEILIRQRLRAE